MSRIKMLLVWCSAVMCFAGNSAAPDSLPHYSAPTELDKMLDAHPIPLPLNKDTVAAAVNAPVFQVQLGALSDIDSAQTRKAVLEQSVGGKIDVVFDPPYYKLRFGKFATQREAEDKLLDLSEKNIQGFVVRQ